MNRDSSQPPQRRPGFTLIELLVAMVLLSTLMLLIVTTLWTAVRIERSDAAAFNRTVVQGQVAERFRTDVAAALDTPAQWQQFSAGPACLILALGRDHHLVYRWDSDRLSRLEFQDDNKSEQFLSLGGEAMTIIFMRSGPGGRVLTLRLGELRGAGKVQREHLTDISATLGGDTR
jgi:prepilin-type N-terminal cleavage/methylation domain-containing protein